ncbi:MAG: Rieske (2Fe-2S) protein [Planctomycetes bacterium]|nr:Rieske (2Fe-2S) protein [Planctomycetota bacterium]
MATWARICSIHDCPPSEAREFVVDGRIVALFHTPDGLFALDGICPHQGGPLGRGQLQGCVVTCPWHGWQFNVKTGQHGTIPSLSQGRIPVRVDGDEVLVQLEA